MTHRRHDCPSWLDDDACREWRLLQSAGNVTGKNPETLAAYCFTLDLWAKVRATLDRLPDQRRSTWTTRDGRRRPHPVLAVEARLAADLLELSEALDLKPTGREGPRPSRVLILD